MRVFLLLAFMVAAASAVDIFDLIKEEWETYKMKFNKKYQSETEEKFRMKIFLENRRRIAKHNQMFRTGAVTFELAENHLADLLPNEFKHIYNGFNKTVPKTTLRGTQYLEKGSTFISPANVELPHAVDWRKHGAVGPVKDQGQCGSCWSFSATGALEGQHFRKTGVLTLLSEQNLIDCSTSYGNNGCNGGLMDNAFRYVKNNGGIDTESSYPYETMDDKCRYNPKNSGATDNGFVDIPEGDEEKLKAAIATVGPVSVAIDASQQSFQLYHSGVYYDENCSSTNLDHGVLAVGYGTDEDGNDYWIVKNSWSDNWGDNGYIKMARNKDNHCGIASSASYPLV